MKYKVQFVLRVTDGTSVSDIENWLGEFQVRHKAFIERPEIKERKSRD